MTDDSTTTNIDNRGGGNNTLSSIGKTILENMISGKFKRNVTPFKPSSPDAASFNLDFYAERDKCLKEKRLFEDPEFPACDLAIYYDKKPAVVIDWKRPSNIAKNPQLIVDTHSRFDVKQGQWLGDCWLLAAVATLTLRDELFFRVVPPDQSFTEKYAGIFHFQFWRYGKWVDVVIDDLLPTVNGGLYSMHSADNNEFWSALLEKAYAKMYGSYENLHGGSGEEALEDFTGGFTEYFDRNRIRPLALISMLDRGFSSRDSLFGCSFAPHALMLDNGLKSGLMGAHDYSITDVRTIKHEGRDQTLLRIRNPWGNSREWKGKWSDIDTRWNEISDEQRQLMHRAKDDGEFWMPFEEFWHAFQGVEVCNLTAEVMDEIYQMTGMRLSTDRQNMWKETQFEASWSVEENTAGGSNSFPKTYHVNPQFGLRCKVTNESVESGYSSIIVTILQKYRRELRKEQKPMLFIGCSIYRESGVRQRKVCCISSIRKYPTFSEAKNKQFFRENNAMATSSGCSNLREVTIRFRIEPGDYVIVPYTKSPNEEAEFLLRIFVNGGEVETKRLPASQ